MCSLFDQSLPLDELLDMFEVQEIGDLEIALRRSIFPRQYIAVVHQADTRKVEMMRWGLVAGWMKEEPKVQPFNARCETVHTNGVFRSAFKSRRCVLPAPRYAEYEGEMGNRTPVWFEPNEGVFALAGLWDEWEQPNGQILRTATMLTCEPNAIAEQYHNRMPLGLYGQDAIDVWMDNDRYDLQELKDLMKPFPTELMRVGVGGQEQD
jgi:putative SOS response-associated peptidase YedK